MTMKHRLTVAVLLLSLAGCHGLRVITHDLVKMETPIQTESRVITETPPVANHNPVVEMPLGCGPQDAHTPKVAVLDVDGLLLNMDMTGPYSMGENPVNVFREKLDAIAADPAVCAVVVRINSPGGGVTASDIMWRDLKAFRTATGRPVVACLMDLGAGGAYYLASAADLIVAHPTTITGGIGVILNTYNLRDTMQYFNVLTQFIKAGPQIDMGTTAAPLSPLQRSLLQTMADEFHDRFRQVVRAARPGADASPETFDGRVFTAGQALERHLIDRVGYLDDAIAAAREAAHQAHARVVLFHRPNDPARTPYAVTPNVPLQSTVLLASVPGLDRSRLPTFLYLWQTDPTAERLSGR
jgi:protease-4